MSNCASSATRERQGRQSASGRTRSRSNVLLAPMSGVTDLPFRRLAHDLGAGLVISEMVASEHLVSDRHDARRRAVGRNLLLSSYNWRAARRAGWRRARAWPSDLGADIIDINMGCPAREVTGKLSGSALMRDLDHALSLIEAVVGAVARAGDAQDAARLGRRQPQRARARPPRRGCRRAADHRARAHALPVLQGRGRLGLRAPRQGGGAHSRRRQRRHRRSRRARAAALAASGADAVMVGRGAYGAPWMPARIADAAWRPGAIPARRRWRSRAAIATAHVEAMLAHYGAQLGLRNARKHIGWYLETQRALRPRPCKAWRRRLCTAEDAARGARRPRRLLRRTAEELAA